MPLLGATVPCAIHCVDGRDFRGPFLLKHRVGNPGGFTELFVRVERGVYPLKMSLHSFHLITPEANPVREVGLNPTLIVGTEWEQ